MSNKRNILELAHGDDFVEYYLFPSHDFSENNTEEKLNSFMSNVNSYIQKYKREYIWHCDEFNLSARTSNTTLLNNDNQTESIPPHLYGVTYYGDNIEDEWFIVYLLFQLSKEFEGLIIRVVDNDGEFLLIEAANYLPEWADPDICTKRTIYPVYPMPFTIQQDTFIVMSHFRSGTLQEDGSWKYSLGSCFQQFVTEYANLEINLDTFTRHRDRVIERFKETGSVFKRKPEKAPTVLTEDVVADIRQRMDVSPTKSVRKLSAQTGISYGSAHKALKTNLHMHPYKVSVLQHLRGNHFEQRLNYCNWFNEIFHEEDLNRTFFSDEAWIHLSGYINSQNYRTWSTENPHVFVENTLHPIKVGVWVAMSKRRIIGPIFFYETINAMRYREQILEPFINSLHDDELTLGYFQQDGATAHTAQQTINYLQEYYGDRLISRNRWPANSPDLTPLDFFLFGHLKNQVFRNRLHNLDELEEAITIELQNITPETLHNVFNNMRRRVNLCIENNGGHFEHLL